GEGGLEFCVGLEGPFAGKPAPTKKSWQCPGLVGAGLPAKAVLNFMLGLKDPSLASQLLQKHRGIWLSHIRNQTFSMANFLRTSLTFFD
ncbi:hypothetical protein, partial [Pseudomonas neuropathica]